jgi:hypothetical protein
MNLKTDILPISEKYEEFYNTLEPVSYLFKEGTSGRTHIGFGAQCVRDALFNNGLTTTEFAGYCHELTPSGEKHYLRYSEFIALNTWQIQKLKSRASDMEQEIFRLRKEIRYLHTEIENLKKF